MERHRIVTWWIYWNDLNWPDPDNMDKIKKRAEGFAKADVSAAMLFGTHFRWDWLPVFPLLHDYIATVAEELHKYGVKLFDHHSVNLVHRYSTREEMRRVMIDSGPHLPFSPTWEAAKTWQYKGQYLNDWRMIDVRNHKPAYFPQYTAECFCHRNPEFQEAYLDYVKELIADTGIDGLSADDGMHYLRFNTCGCKYCREELHNRSGIDLPPVEDRSFWFNWDNPAWHRWVDVRFDATGEFYGTLAKVLPEGFVLTGCGSDSASAMALDMATDARQFLKGCNYVNLEMNGNTPPYKHDPKTINRPISYRMATSSHHKAAAREKGVRALNTGFAHSPIAADHCWAVSKLLDADAWIGTLKTRLGLPWRILNTLPEEKDLVGRAFGFEKNHPKLFEGELVGQLGIYFSYETRNYTMFGGAEQGYAKDFSHTINSILREGISPHTVFSFPEDCRDYPLILVSSVLRMLPCEKEKMKRYLEAGGKVIVTGPSPLDGCPNTWKFPNVVEADTEDLFMQMHPDGIRPRTAPWITRTVFADSNDPDVWYQPVDGLYYHPHRISSNRNLEKVLEICRKSIRPLPVQTVRAKGYLTACYENEEQITVHFLAEDYDVDIDHELDRIRFHRSRLNLVNKVEPIGIDGILQLKSEIEPLVYTPFHEEMSKVEMKNGICTIELPEKCSYAIAQFKK